VRRFTGEILVVSSALFFATSGVIAKLIIAGGISPVRLTQIRTTGVFIVLLIFLLITNRKSLRVTRKELPNLALMGIFGIAGVQAFYFFAVTRMPVSITLVIEFTAPIWIAIYIRYFRKEMVKPMMWWGIGSALAGLLLVTEIWQGLRLDGLGVIAAFIDALFLAYYFVRLEVTVKMRDGLSLLVYVFGFATLLLAIVQPIWLFPREIFTSELSLEELSPGNYIVGWELIAILIIFGSIVPYLFITYGVKRIPASQASVIAMLEPVIAGGIAWLVLSEALTPLQIIGGATVLAGIYLTERARPGAVEEGF
jgi:drug/metabolite transporter (DMT)-like permease